MKEFDYTHQLRVIFGNIKELVNIDPGTNRVEANSRLLRIISLAERGIRLILEERFQR
jgi:hypothetical protein